MKTIKQNFLILVMICLPGLITAETKSLSLDTKNSKIEWTGKKVLGQHNGTVDFSTGKLLVNGNTLTGGEFTVDLTTITNIDLKDPDYNQKLIGHLKSPEFFSVEKYPSATILIRKVEKYNATPGKYKITADATIKGITNSITFDAFLKNNSGKFSGTANIILDRTKWDIKYGSSSFFDNLGDKAIKNEIELNVKIEAI